MNAAVDSAPPSPAKRTTKKDISEVLKDVERYIDQLNKTDIFYSDECLKMLKNISKFYWGYPFHRKYIGDKLAELNYADQLVKMLKIFNREGVFKDDNIWFSTYYSMNIIWNFSDVSSKLCKELIISGIIDIAGTNIAHKPYLDNQSSQNVAYLLKSSLSIIHNLTKSMRDLPEFKEAFEKARIKETLHNHYLISENEFFKCVATMIITSIISEEENKMLVDTGAIPFIVNTLKHAINDSDKRRHRGFAPAELVNCLSRMAMNDKNKEKIIEEGALAELVKMMEYDDSEENAVAANTVWILSFKKDIREKVKAEKGLLDALIKLKESTDITTRTSAEGALWTINIDQYKTKEDSGTISNEHIFISYAWSEQPVVKQINSRLKEAGYRTWVDFEQMSGSTLEAMARGIEGASAVLICASDKYKHSPNCRAEAEYTFQLKKDIVPLMMQRYYKPDGWLGMLIGAKFYINFDGKYDFETAFQMLLEQLAGRGKIKSSAVNSSSVIQPSSSTADTKTIPSVVNASYTRWTEKEVDEFFEKAGLTRIKSHFPDYNGKMLECLKKLKDEAPNFFYNHLENKMQLELKEIVKLIVALNSL